MRKGSGAIPKCHPERKHAANGLCTTCNVVRWRTMNPERNRLLRDRERSRAGITYQVNDKILASAKRCALCETPFDVIGKKQRSPILDHDHKTGKLRDVLCNQCNKALGWFADDPALLRRAAAYLEKHQTAGNAVIQLA